MAVNCAEDYVQGEMLDFFFEFMEEDECDDMLDAHLNLAVDEVNLILLNLYPCDDKMITKCKSRPT